MAVEFNPKFEKDLVDSLQSVATVSIVTTFRELNQKALDEFNKKFSDYAIFNTSFEGDGKDAKFLGAGENILLFTAKKEELLDKDFKKQALDGIKTYVHWYSGPDISEKIKEDDLIPYTRKLTDDELAQKNQNANNEISDEDADNNQENNETTDNNAEEESTDNSNEEENSEGTNESLFIKNFINILFESTEDEDISNANLENEKIIGYQLKFRTEIGKEQGSTLDNAAKRLGKKLLDTLSGFGIKFGPTDLKSNITIGDVADTFQKKYINPTNFVSTVDAEMKKKYPALQSTVDYLDTKSAVSYLKDRLNKVDQNILNSSGAKYVVGIKINTKGKSAEFINKRQIADMVTSAIENSKDAGNLTQLKYILKQINPKNIVLIDDYSSDAESGNKDRFDTGEKTDTVQNANESLIAKEILDLILENIEFEILEEGHDYSIGQIKQIIKRAGYKNILAAKDNILNWVSGKKRTDNGKLTQYGKVFGVPARKDKKTGEIKKEKQPGFYDKFFNCTSDEEMFNLIDKELNPNGRDANKPPETVGERNAIYLSLEAANIPDKQTEPESEKEPTPEKDPTSEKEPVKIRIEFIDIDPENPDDKSKQNKIGEPLELNVNELDKIKYPEPPKHDGYEFTQWDISPDDLKTKIQDENTEQQAQADEISNTQENSSDENTEQQDQSKETSDEQVNDSFIMKSLLTNLFEDNENQTDKNEETNKSSETTDENIKTYTVKTGYKKTQNEEPKGDPEKDPEKKPEIDNKQIEIVYIDKGPSGTNNDIIATQKISLDSELSASINYPPVDELRDNKDKVNIKNTWTPSREELIKRIKADFPSEKPEETSKKKSETKVNDSLNEINHFFNLLTEESDETPSANTSVENKNSSSTNAKVLKQYEVLANYAPNKYNITITFIHQIPQQQKDSNSELTFTDEQLNKEEIKNVIITKDGLVKQFTNGQEEPLDIEYPTDPVHDNTDIRYKNVINGHWSIPKDEINTKIAEKINEDPKQDDVKLDVRYTYEKKPIDHKKSGFIYFLIPIKELGFNEKTYSSNQASDK